ncbi:serine/threonine protein phosphatase 1 [Natranaerovirga pectinivora]|uniref:Serine/threonine protein phosphatase 1 n=1 Tax=Natranaerovirga pectinivora TaxID=682400 RepID=A0A4R3MKQ8_9FIRM|nr:metallophosphoesterase [Natranaerovirga pectinivora]TCT14526.1 serine/threonine protein phosphatase 1 [Natranaerovirga pectinivora]
MAFTYVISDIHGFIDEFEDALKKVDLSGDNQLILLGDYIDLGPDSYKVLYRIMNLQKEYPKNIIVLKGNHEGMFIEFVKNGRNDWLSEDKNLKTSKTFLTKEQLDEVKKMMFKRDKIGISRKVKESIKYNHPTLLKWLNQLPCYYETKDRIFVHAGVDEEAGELWKIGTSDETFLWKFPATTGKFYKDIIAGHISTATIAGNKDFHDIFFDNASHFYIDGDIEVSHRIPILKIDNVTGKYYSILENGEEKCLK